MTGQSTTSGDRPPATGETATSTGDGTPGDSTPALVVEGLTKQFGSGPDAVTAVDNVSFTIERGSVVGLLGPNGAGKTTTIKSILGMILPDAGDVRIHGIDVYDDPRAAYAHVDAMLEGARNDYWRLTVRENLRYFATINGIKPDSIADRHDELLARLDLTEWADEPVRNLSRGMKQKVSLASVLAGGSDLVFLDEPTLGLDVESSLALRRELRRIIAERGLTVVVSSHDMDVIEAVCDRVIIMNEGRVVADDTVGNLISSVDASGFRVTSGDLTPDIVATLRERFEVTDVAQRGDRMQLTVAADGDGFYELTDLLREAGVTLDAVETVEPDLEDIFVDLTRREES